MNNPTIDCTGRRWFPHEGDLVRDTESGRYGVVLRVTQRANDLAYARCVFEHGPDDWTIVEVPATQLERDTRDDIEPPSFADRRATMSSDEAAGLVLANVEEIATFRHRVGSDDALVSVLEIEAQRALVLARAHADRWRYDLARRENRIAARMRELSVAVSIELARRPVVD